MNRDIARGFTLIEVLLALAIFAALSLGAFQALEGMLRNDQISQQKARRLAELQRALTMLEADFSQIVSRHSRGNEAVFSAARFQLHSEDWSASFIRNGWQNPLGMLPRSELQNVAYRLRNHQLERLSYRHVDPIPGEEPTVKVVLPGINAFRLRFFARQGWQETWSSTSQLPQAVEVTLALPDLGDISRLFLLTGEAAQ